MITGGLETADPAQWQCLGQAGGHLLIGQCNTGHAVMSPASAWTLTIPHPVAEPETFRQHLHFIHPMPK